MSDTSQRLRALEQGAAGGQVIDRAVMAERRAARAEAAEQEQTVEAKNARATANALARQLDAVTTERDSLARELGVLYSQTGRSAQELSAADINSTTQTSLASRTLQFVSEFRVQARSLRAQWRQLNSPTEPVVVLSQPAVGPSPEELAVDLDPSPEEPAVDPSSAPAVDPSEKTAILATDREELLALRKEFSEVRRASALVAGKLAHSRAHTAQMALQLRLSQTQAVKNAEKAIAANNAVAKLTAALESAQAELRARDVESKILSTEISVLRDQASASSATIDRLQSQLSELQARVLTPSPDLKDGDNGFLTSAIANRPGVVSDAPRCAEVEPHQLARSPEIEPQQLVARLQAAAEALRLEGGAPKTQQKGPAPAPVKALIKLAEQRPESAAQLIVALLPAHGLINQPIDYDLTLAHAGTFAVRCDGKDATVTPIARKRRWGRRQLQLRTTPLELAKLLSGTDSPALGLNLRAYLGKTALQRAVQASDLSFEAVVDRTGPLPVGPALQALSLMIAPEWTSGARFTIAIKILSDQTESNATNTIWYLIARDGRGLSVARTPLLQLPDATVTVSPTAFTDFLIGRVTNHDKPHVRGDREVIQTLMGWIEQVRVHSGQLTGSPAG